MEKGKNMKLFRAKFSTMLVFLSFFAHLAAHSDTGKTFLLPRSSGVDLPRLYSTFDNLILEKDKNLKGFFQIDGFYEETTKSDKMGKFFLIKNKSTINLRSDLTDLSPLGDPTAKGTTNDFDITYILHKNDLDPALGAALNTIGMTLKLRPERTVYGVDLYHYHNLDKLCKGLFAYILVPVFHVEHDLNIQINGDRSVPFVGAPNNIIGGPVIDNMTKFFAGNFSAASNNDQGGIPTGAAAGFGQQQLNYAKMAGKQIATGVSDIDFGIGYIFLNQDAYHASVAAALTFPTSRTKGEYLFEPTYGNGHHFAIGGDIDLWLRLFGNNNHNLKLKASGKVRYLMEGTEKRTLAIKGREWSQYLLLGKVGQDQLVPAANVLTTDVSVTPGTQFDGILGLGYQYGGFCCDLGYEMYGRERTSVHLDSFPNYTYAIAARGYVTGVPLFALTDANVDGGNVEQAMVNIDTIDTSVAETPSQFTNSIYGSLGYIFDSSTPVMLNIGGKYEWADKNSAFDQWGVWAKIGFGF